MRRIGLQDGMYCGVRRPVPCLETAGFGMECGPLCNRLSDRLLTGVNLAARLGMEAPAAAGGLLVRGQKWPPLPGGHPNMSLC